MTYDFFKSSSNWMIISLFMLVVSPSISSIDTPACTISLKHKGISLLICKDAESVRDSAMLFPIVDKYSWPSSRWKPTISRPSICSQLNIYSLVSHQTCMVSYLKTKESHLWYIRSCSYRMSVEFDLPRLSIWLTYLIASLLFPAILICCSRNWWICLLTSSCWSYSPLWWWLYILTLRSLK